MIAQKIEYYKPESWKEAFECMQDLKSQNMQTVYYSGGTEIVTNLRKGAMKADALIDLKGIEEMGAIKVEGETICIGANVPLNAIIEHESTAFMKPVLDKIADHTVRNTLTIGGNICGRLPYREAVLPFIALNAIVRIVDGDGIQELPIREVFDKRLKLPADAFMYQIVIPASTDGIDMWNRRETEGTDVDYPIIHTVFYEGPNAYFVGLSGFASFPIYHVADKTEKSLEDFLDAFKSQNEKLAKEDDRATKAYRTHLLDVHIKSILGGQK